MSLELGTLNIGQVGRLQKERSALCHSDLLQTLPILFGIAILLAFRLVVLSIEKMY